MELEDFNIELTDSLAKNEVITFFCNCEISYSGRAEAYLPRGDRLIIIKSDRVLLIHQPENGMPVNYLKPGSSIRLEKIDDGLVLRAQSEKDFLDVEILKVYDFLSRKLVDGQKQILQGNERDMSNMLHENPSMISDDFIPLSREEHTKFGFIDVFGHDGNGNLIIVECKRFTASLACVTQLRRYVEKIKELKGIDTVKGIMASPAISANALAMLEQWGFTHVLVNPPKRLERYNRDQKSLLSY